MAKTYYCGRCNYNHGFNTKIGKSHKKFKKTIPKKPKQPLSRQVMLNRIAKVLKKNYNLEVWNVPDINYSAPRITIVRPYYRFEILFGSISMEDPSKYRIYFTKSEKTKKNDPYDWLDSYQYKTISKKNFSTINNTAESVAEYIIKFYKLEKFKK